jgi:hypothetical protein
MKRYRLQGNDVFVPDMAGGFVSHSYAVHLETKLAEATAERDRLRKLVSDLENPMDPADEGMLPKYARYAIEWFRKEYPKC